MRGRAVGVGLLLAMGACARDATNAIDNPEPGSTVLFVTIEGVDRGRLSAHGAGQMPMAVLSELAQEGRVYEHFVPAAVGANAALATLFTGLAPEVHGVGRMRTLGGSRLGGELDTVAMEFQRAGWRTIAAVSEARLSEEVSGFEKGFDAYDAPPISSGTRPRSSGETADALLGRIHELARGAEPLFAWLHLADLDADRPAEAKWCEPWLQRSFAGLAESDEGVAAALALAPGDVFAALGQLSLRRRGSSVWVAWHQALHDAALERQDYALGRVLNALVAGGRGEELRVVVCGVEAGNWKASGAGEAGGGSARPGAGSFAPLVVWRRGEARSERVAGIVSGLDVRGLLLGEAVSFREEAWIMDAELLDALRVGAPVVGGGEPVVGGGEPVVGGGEPVLGSRGEESGEVRALRELRAGRASLSVTHSTGRADELVVQIASSTCALRGDGGRRGERLRHVLGAEETLSVVTEERYPQLTLRLEGEGMDERSLRWGGTPMEELDVGLLGVGTAPLWPAGDESWSLDLARDGQDPALSLLSVAEGRGVVRLVLEDAADLELQVGVRDGEVVVEDHPLLFGARVVVGSAPFVLELRGVRPKELSVAAFAAGERMPTWEMRHMGRRWGGGGAIEWLISGPAWTVWVRPAVMDRRSGISARVVLEFGHRVPDEREVRWKGREARAFARRLGRTE